MTSYIYDIVKELRGTCLKNDVRKYLVRQLCDNIQHGGGKTYEKKIKYGDYTFTLKIHITKQDTQIVILPCKYQCGIVRIYKGCEEADLVSFGANPKCAVMSLCKSADTFIQHNSGTILINFMLAFLRKSKKEYGITRVGLTDNSYLPCKNCPKQVLLSDIYTLMEGTTWYGKFGFIPIRNNEYYLKNKEIMKNSKARDLPIKQLLDEYLLDKHMTNKDYIREHMVYILEMFENENKLLKTIFREISIEKCCLLPYLQKIIFANLGLTSFYGHEFYLEL